MALCFIMPDQFFVNLEFKNFKEFRLSTKNKFSIDHGWNRHGIPKPLNVYLDPSHLQAICTCGLRSKTNIYLIGQVCSPNYHPQIKLNSGDLNLLLETRI